MTKITDLTGAAWTYDDSAATAGSTGLGAVSTNGWTMKADATAPNGVGYLQNRGGENTAPTFKINSTANPYGADNDYWLRWFMRVRRTSTSFTASSTAWYIMLARNAGSTAVVQLIGGERKLEYGGVAGGLPSVYIQAFSASGSGAGVEGTSNSTAGVTGNYAFDVWTEMVFHIHRGTGTDGYFELFQNGVLLARQYGLDTDQVMSNAGVDWTMTMGNASSQLLGCVIDIAPPFEAWTGTDITGLRPQYSKFGASSPVLAVYNCSFPNEAKGGYLDASASGAATITSTTYTTTSFVSGRRRYVCAGASELYAVSTIDEIGTLTYNAAGWVTIAFPMLYHPSGNICDITIKAPGGASNLLTVGFDGSANFAENVGGSPVNLCAYTPADRYALLLHLSSSGAASYTLINMTQSPVNTRTVWSGALSGWTPGALGQIEIGGGTNGSELEGIWITKYLDLVGIDSIAGTGVGVVSPYLAGMGQVGLYRSYGVEVYTIPGGIYPGRDNGTYPVVAWAPFTVGIPIGRAGGTRTTITANSIAHMTHTHGVRFVNIDGGSVNDVPGTLAGVPAAVTARIADVQTLLTKMQQTGNKVLLTTMLRREQLTTGSQIYQQYADLFNNEIRRLAREKQSSSSIELADAAAYVEDHGTQCIDATNVHFTNAGCKVVADAISQNTATPTAYSGGVNHIGGANKLIGM